MHGLLSSVPSSVQLHLLLMCQCVKKQMEALLHVGFLALQVTPFP